MSELRTSGLWKGYAGTEVLRGVDLEVAPGSLTAVLGLSGSGKTTFLRVVAGFERAERGSVQLGGQMLDDGRRYVPPERRGIGYVPQEGALFPHLNVRENVGFGLSRAERRGTRVTDLLEMVELAPLAKRLPHELSGGEQQRVALARALARRPQALLLDEPFSSLDASLRAHVREEVHGLLLAQGATTVLVTHDQEEALSLADTVAVLRDGRIIQRGAPAELYEQPVDERLAQFLGAVNLVAAELRDGLAQTSLGALALRPAAGAGPGIVLIRPEQLEVRVRDAVENPGEGVSGVVEECRYYGHDALLRIRTDPAGAEPLLARVAGAQTLPAGTPVRVRASGAVSSRGGAHVDETATAR
jgi:iron(III) transport system ATP-binding protein